MILYDTTVNFDCIEICQLFPAAVNPLLFSFSHFLEIDELQIHSLQYHIQHESIPLAEEKQILREIKQLEGTREKVIANAAMRAKIQDSLGQKEAIQDQVKVRKFYFAPLIYQSLLFPFPLLI